MGPASADEIEERLWNELAFGLYGERRAQALADIDMAIASREKLASKVAHIWALSLKIELLRYEHEREDVVESARVGEQRLALRRELLSGHPAEWMACLRELAGLYEFEGEPFDERRHRELLAEAATIAQRLGSVEDGR